MKLWSFLKRKKPAEERKEKECFIISVDGGGMRGIVPVRVLLKLDELAREAGMEGTLFDHADLIAGTSTGGLIALAAASGRNYSLDYIYNVYMTNSKRIFTEPNSIMRRFFTDKYDSTGFEEYLAELFGNDSMADLVRNCIVMTYDIAEGEPFPITNREKGILVREAARATSAAPTYFSPKGVRDRTNGKKHLLVDGGVVANNPALYAYKEAKLLYPDADKYILLSLSTASAPFTFKTEGGALAWVDLSQGLPIQKVLQQAQMQTAGDIVSNLDDVEYIRIDGRTDVPLKLDATTPEALEILDRTGASIAELAEPSLRPLAPRFASHVPLSKEA